MKNLATAILAVLYLVTSIGATIHMHYCMGEVADWSLAQDTSDTCGQCGMDKKDSADNGCCKDEKQLLKSESAQKITENNLQLLQLVSTALPVSFVVWPDVALATVTEENPNSNAPPRSCTVAIYKRNCVFRI